MIEHPIILDMFRHKGFSNTWITWIKDILCSSTSQGLLKGIPGKPIKCKRGVRQGDPLSPLLFVMAADLLQTIINSAFQLNLLKHPLSRDFGQSYPIVQYANDTIIIIPAEAIQLFTLKGILGSFADSIGLKDNYGKSFLVPINISDDKAMHLTNTIGCQVSQMPFTYLGLPLGTTRSSVEDFQPLLHKIKKCLLGLNILLSYYGRLTYVNSIVSALPTFFMCAFKIPVKILDQVDKYHKHYLWDKGDINRKEGCLVAWKKETRQKK
jgi:hypothetical protein